MSAFGNRALRGLQYVPMQWGRDGKPTWRAPRWLALSFTPALAAVVLAAVVTTGGAHAGSRTGLVGVGFIGAHALHIFRSRRSRDGG